MVHPYLRRRNGEEAVEFPDERVRGVLEKTLGVPLFQEQAMKLAVVAAGFTPGEADQLRRAMGAWRRPGVIDQFRQKLMDGMQANGYAREFAERVFNQIRGFGEYGFPESHAASFALLVYVSCWLKRYFPDAFTTALLNSQPMGFYAPAQLIAAAKKDGVPVLPVDVNFSDWDSTLEEVPAGGETGERSPDSSHGKRSWALRLGMRMVRGLSRKHAEVLVRARENGGFFSLRDIAQRTGLGSAILAKLSRADVFGSVGLNRRDALWHSLPEQKLMPLFDDAEPEQPGTGLPSMTPQQEVVADYRSVGLSLRDHPMKFLRPMLQRLRAVPAKALATLPHGRRLTVAGLVLLRQRPSTAKGITFVTLEDETGMANLIIRPEIWERYHQAARRARALLVHGSLQRQNQVIHVEVHKLEDLSARLTDLSLRSRDFR
jgi:error-prone DNA polymerase